MNHVKFLGLVYICPFWLHSLQNNRTIALSNLKQIICSQIPPQGIANILTMLIQIIAANSVNNFFTRIFPLYFHKWQKHSSQFSQVNYKRLLFKAEDWFVRLLMIESFGCARVPFQSESFSFLHGSSFISNLSSY